MPVQHFKTNLNCGGCVAAVKPYLDENPSIQRWSVNTGDPDKVLAVEGPEVSAEAVERDVARGGFAVLGRLERPQTAVPPTAPAAQPAEERSFFTTYRPLLLVLAYLLGVVALVEFAAGSFEPMRAMRVFMGGFFVAFSFFSCSTSAASSIHSRPMMSLHARCERTATHIPSSN